MVSSFRPYNDLSILPGSFDYRQKDFLQLAIKANYGLAKLDGLSLLLPNYELLISPLLAKESIASNEIENINTTMVQFLQQEAINQHRLTGAEKEVHHYRHTIMEGIDRMVHDGGISTNLLIVLQNIIEPSKSGIRKIPGTVIANHHTGEVLYTPPQGEQKIRDLMANLENFINTFDDTIDPLIKVAVIHYQFETIHPFYDGNGRIGRILMILYLMLTQKISKPILFLSSYINQNKSRYYASFTQGIGENDYRSMIEFLLQGIIEQSKETETKILRINHLINKYIALFQEYEYKDSYRLAMIFFTYPFIDITTLAQKLSLSRQTIYDYIKKLESDRLIRVVKIGRHKLVSIPEFIDFLS